MTTMTVNPEIRSKSFLVGKPNLAGPPPDGANKRPTIPSMRHLVADIQLGLRAIDALTNLLSDGERDLARISALEHRQLREKVILHWREFIASEMGIVIEHPPASNAPSNTFAEVYPWTMENMPLWRRTLEQIQAFNNSESLHQRLREAASEAHTLGDLLRNKIYGADEFADFIADSCGPDLDSHEGHKRLGVVIEALRDIEDTLESLS